MKKQTTWEETLYQLLGVKQYCKFLIWVKLHYDRLRGKPDTDNYFLRGGSLEDLQFLRGQLIKNAKIYGFGTAICLFCALIAGRFWVILLALLVGMHNLYCVLVQRMNLLRLDRLSNAGRQRKMVPSIQQPNNNFDILERSIPDETCSSLHSWKRRQRRGDRFLRRLLRWL